MAIIAISEQIGSLAAELGRLSAEKLGYRLLTRSELIVQAARVYHVSPEQLLIIDERRPYFWQRLKTDSERFFSYVRAVVLKEMARDRLVVVGRTVAHLLPPYGCGLRVRAIGLLADRSRKIAEDEKLTPIAAERRIREAEREVRARHETLLGIDTEDPANYDLVVNCFALPLAVLANTLAGMAQHIDSHATKEAWRRMRDAAIAAEVRAACHAHPKIGHAPIEVQCIAGAVQVNGPGLVPPWDGLVDQVARQVEGVESVEVMAEEQPVLVRPS